VVNLLVVGSKREDTATISCTDYRYQPYKFETLLAATQQDFFKMRVAAEFVVYFLWPEP
jgi:hypothetical protein